MTHKSAILLFSLIIISSCNKEKLPKPNVILILADDLGVHQVGEYGSKFYETPNIDALAQSGIKFNNAYAAATVCSPTRASIMTGKYPARLHLTDYIPGKTYQNKKLLIPDWNKYLSKEETTIAEVFKNAGYKTAHFGKWHLNKNKKYELGRVGDPGSQGFDEVLTTHKPGAGPESKYENDKHHVKEITEHTLQFIKENRENPFFAYLSHNTIHAPEIENPELISKYKEKHDARQGGSNNPVQAAMLETLDNSISEILERLDELGLSDNTIVIFFSDNGQLADKNGYPYRGSKGDLYEGGIRMPLIIKWPNIIKAGSISSELVISNDFFPTFVDLLNLESENTSEDGISLLPLLNDPELKLKRNTLYWHYPHYHGNGLGPQGAIRKGKYKLIEWFEKSYFKEQGAYELYDLIKDPGEGNNLADELPEMVNKLSADLLRWRQDVGAQSMTINAK